MRGVIGLFQESPFYHSHHLPSLVCASLSEVVAGCESTTNCSCNHSTDQYDVICDVYSSDQHMIIDRLLILTHLLEFPFGEFWMRGADVEP